MMRRSKEPSKSTNISAATRIKPQEPSQNTCGLTFSRLLVKRSGNVLNWLNLKVTECSVFSMADSALADHLLKRLTTNTDRVHSALVALGDPGQTMFMHSQRNTISAATRTKKKTEHFPSTLENFLPKQRSVSAQTWLIRKDFLFMLYSSEENAGPDPSLNKILTNMENPTVVRMALVEYWQTMFIRLNPIAMLVVIYGDNVFSRAITWMIGAYPSETAVSNCAYTAKKKGYKGFGVQFGGQCFGSTGAHHESVYGKYGKSDKCSGGVGGWSANDVYLFY